MRRDRRLIPAARSGGAARGVDPALCWAPRRRGWGRTLWPRAAPPRRAVAHLHGAGVGSAGRRRAPVGAAGARPAHNFGPQWRLPKTVGSGGALDRCVWGRSRAGGAWVGPPRRQGRTGSRLAASGLLGFPTLISPARERPRRRRLRGRRPSASGRRPRRTVRTVRSGFGLWLRHSAYLSVGPLSACGARRACVGRSWVAALALGPVLGRVRASVILGLAPDRLTLGPSCACAHAGRQRIVQRTPDWLPLPHVTLSARHGGGRCHAVFPWKARVAARGPGPRRLGP